MLKNYNKRGSVLLMVVGLLVILGTLGGTFLLVSNLDARQSRLLAGRGRAELIASGGVGKVVRILGEDLHFAPVKSSAPYTAPNTEGADKYKFFIDHTSIDTWLYGPDHPSDVFGAGLGNGSLVSTESDSGAAGDSYLVPTGEFSDDGEQYYIAVKVVDLSSLLSLNTGGEDYLNGVTDTSKVLRSPALIRLKEWMGTVYASIHKGRCGGDSGGTNRPITDYDPQCGRVLLSTLPEFKYMPFAIADEVYLRWLGSGGKASFGRVFDYLGGNSIGTNINKRRMLTTTNSSRSIVRNPITGVISSRIDLSKPGALDSAIKDALYAQLVFIAGSDDGTGGGASAGITRVIDNNTLGGGFYVSHPRWLHTGEVDNAYNRDCRRYKGTGQNAWWVFKDLPQASYRVWASWGSPTLPTGSIVPYMVYSGGRMVGRQYSGGTLKGSYIANQTRLPTDGNFNGAHWQSLGSHWAEGQLVVEIHGVQGVPPDLPAGEIPFAFADAVRIEGISLNLGSGSQPAAHLTANLWTGMSEYKPETPGKAFAYRPPGKNYVVFGVQEQPFITEAFATHTTRTLNADGTTWVEDSWKWGAAVELMNFSSREIDLKDYGLVFGSILKSDTPVYKFPAGWKISAATNTKGGRLVLYDFGAGRADVTATNVFGVDTGQWKRVTGLNFDNQTIRLVRVAKDNDDANKEYRVPIDHVVAGNAAKGDMEYAQRTEDVKTSIEPTKTVSSNCRRDDVLTRHRYSVAKYSKTGPTDGAVTAASHKLGQDNSVTFPETTLKEGFRIKLRHGLLSGPGDASDLYIAGPIVYDDASSAPADLPELLAKDFATKESRGRANSHAENDPVLLTVPWNVYPRQRGAAELAWPLLLGEIIETVPMDLGRGDSPTRVYGRINVNTASQEVLQQLPWPTGINAASGASKIVAYRSSKGGFVTPGEVALALDGLTGKDAAGEPLDRDSIYAAISSCITVNSDMYAVTVRVQLGASKTPTADRSWYYLAVIDRGCAVFSTDKPAVLLFTQMK